MAEELYKVVAFDPGGVTGWAVFGVRMKGMIDPYRKILSNIAWWKTGEFFGSEEAMALSMADLAIAWDDAHLVMEDFILRRFSTDRDLLSPVRVQARFEQTMAIKKDARPLILQPVDLVKERMSDERLRQAGLGIYDATTGQKDARMAAKHALVWLIRAKKMILLNQATKVPEG